MENHSNHLEDTHIWTYTVYIHVCIYIYIHTCMYTQIYIYIYLLPPTKTPLSTSFLGGCHICMCTYIYTLHTYIYIYTVYIDLDVKIKCVMYFGGIGANNFSHGLAGHTVLVRIGSQSMLEDGHSTWKNLWAMSFQCPCLFSCCFGS